MNDQKTQGEHWKVFALFLEGAMKSRGMTRYRLAKETGVAESTIKRFFELECCSNFNTVLNIANAVGVDMIVKDRL